MAPAKEAKKVRGVYEHPKGSDIWWVQYFDRGKRHRERVGRKSDAIKLVAKRKTQILQGEKLPELNRRRPTFGELLDDSLAFARDHGRVMRNYEYSAALLRKAFGPRAAEDIRPEEFTSWMRERKLGAASFNRYRAFLSLCFREGIRAGKVKSNTALLIVSKTEPRGRLRFLSRDEYERVALKIRELYPQHLPAFVLSVHSGMRLTEQYTLTWGENIDFERGEIRLFKTKNGDDRTIPMSSVVRDVLLSIRPEKKLPKALLFPRVRGGKGSVKPRWFEKVMHDREVAIEDYTWHNNRHTFCSWLAIAGCSLKTIQELAGHRTIEMSARYAHLSPDHKRSELERMATAGAPRILEFPTATKTANRA